MQRNIVGSTSSPIQRYTVSNREREKNNRKLGFSTSNLNIIEKRGVTCTAGWKHYELSPFLVKCKSYSLSPEGTNILGL